MGLMGTPSLCTFGSPYICGGSEYRGVRESQRRSSMYDPPSCVCACSCVGVSVHVGGVCTCVCGGGADADSSPWWPW